MTLSIHARTKLFAKDYKIWLRGWNKLWDKTYSLVEGDPMVYDGEEIERALKLLILEAGRLGRYEERMKKLLQQKVKRAR